MRTIVDHWVQIVDVTSVTKRGLLGLRKALGVQIGVQKSIVACPIADLACLLPQVWENEGYSLTLHVLSFFAAPEIRLQIFRPFFGVGFRPNC